ncbi:hypothetical protein JHX88_06210 [Paracoccus saliphilus]|uniref:Uncharacterized protein n=1 Tax=Paracoccus saliphilus TaxID=405559 RepID=A0ABY7SBC4_9RHOB|nr:hypothetical protein [Paracoccus saliphilus]WCR04321.1 hypothetical protein JHX88_06210 [Paracoccus saliphilus]
MPQLIGVAIRPAICPKPEVFQCWIETATDLRRFIDTEFHSCPLAGPCPAMFVVD